MTIPVSEIIERKIAVQPDLVKSLIGYIDLTSLSNVDTDRSIQELAEKANAGFEGVYPAAVCTFSTFAELVKQIIKHPIQCAVVGGCFPTGQTLSTAKIAEVQLIADLPVDEVDVVINRGDLLSGKDDQIITEIKGMKQVLGSRTLKVILETGELSTPENITRACKIAIEAGADFLKTSTGKSAIGCTPEAFYTMCLAAKNHHKITGKRIGVKASGGIRNLDDALDIYKIVKAVLGDEWLTPKYFRIGASSLYDHLIQSPLLHQ